MQPGRAGEREKGREKGRERGRGGEEGRQTNATCVEYHLRKMLNTLSENEMERQRKRGGEAGGKTSVSRGEGGRQVPCGKSKIKATRKAARQRGRERRREEKLEKHEHADGSVCVCVSVMVSVCVYVCVCVKQVAGVRASRYCNAANRPNAVCFSYRYKKKQSYRYSYKSSYRYLQALMNTLHTHTYIHT